MTSYCISTLHTLSLLILKTVSQGRNENIPTLQIMNLEIEHVKNACPSSSRWVEVWWTNSLEYRSLDKVHLVQNYHVLSTIPH